MQVFRTFRYFSLPRQAEPFSAVILTAKTVMRICLLISAFILVVSLLLIFCSCSDFQVNAGVLVTSVCLRGSVVVSLSSVRTQFIRTSR